jgi:pentatricopeptide repeat protein
MHNEARELFARMADLGLVPNEKTYGIMIKVYSSTQQDEDAVALLERMRGQWLEPDRYAYHHAIRSCIALQRVEHAAALYNDMVQAKVPPLASTCVLLSGACKACGWTSLEAKLMADLARVKEACAANI